MKRSNGDLLRGWEQYVASMDCSNDWKRRYIRHVDTWFTWLGTHRKNALDATPGDALEFWAVAAGNSPSSKKQQLTALNGFYTWVQAYMPSRNPFAAIPKVRKSSPPPRPTVEPDELIDLVLGWEPATWPEHRDQAMIAALVSTGCRVSECCDMDIDDPDFRRRAVLIRNGKGDKPRWCALVPGALELVRTYTKEVRPIKARNGERALWLNNRGKRARPESARATVKRVCKRLGIDVKLTPHGIRASAITAVYRHSHDVLAARNFGGHANVQTTIAHYIRQMPDEIVDIAEEHHPLALIAATRDTE